MRSNEYSWLVRSAARNTAAMLASRTSELIVTEMRRRRSASAESPRASSWKRFDIPLRTMTPRAAQASQPKRWVVIRITRRRTSASSMARRAGTVTRNMKNCGPSQTVTATMWSQGVIASLIGSLLLDHRLDGDRLLALRADGYQVGGRGQELLDPPDVGAGVLRQVLEPPGAGRVLLPARQLLVHRLRPR